MQLALQALESEDVRLKKSQAHNDYQASLGRKQKAKKPLGVSSDGPSTISNPVNVQHLTTVTKDFKWTGGEPEDMFDFVEVVGQGYPQTATPLIDQRLTIV